ASLPVLESTDILMPPFRMYMTASLGCPWEKTTFPLGYSTTRRAVADSRKIRASKAGPVSTADGADCAFGRGIGRAIIARDVRRPARSTVRLGYGRNAPLLVVRVF